MVAVVAGVVVAGRDGEPAPTTDRGPVGEVPADAVAISSDATPAATLEDLLAAADVVVRGEVVATERGRWFGGAGSARLQSRFVTLRVDDVLAGDDPGAPSVLLEEEGWLEDGSPVVVDGAAPSRVGDAGIWFLADGGDAEVGALVVVGAQGRYLDDGDGGLVGAAGGDPLVVDLASGSPDALADRIRAG